MIHSPTESFLWVFETGTSSQSRGTRGLQPFIWSNVPRYGYRQATLLRVSQEFADPIVLRNHTVPLSSLFHFLPV